MATNLIVLLLLFVAVNAVQGADSHPVNLALNQKAYQSSVAGNRFERHGPERAVDGIVPKSCLKEGCVISAYESNPWWAVYLGTAYDVGVVKLVNRPDGYGWRSNHFVVGLTNTFPKTLRPNFKNYQVCGEYNGKLLHGQTATVTCKASSFKAEYVLLQFPMKDYMNFAEVEVYERAASKVPDTKSGGGGGGSGGGSGAGSKTCNNTKCPAGFTYVPSVSGCYKVIMENKNWIEAGRSCRAAHADAHLLVIDNVAEQLAMKDVMHGKQFGNCRSAWGGISLFTAGQRVTSGKTDFVWRLQSADGCSDRVSRIDYSNWTKGQPDFFGRDESCLTLARDLGYQWNDASCSVAMCSVCEIDI